MTFKLALAQTCHPSDGDVISLVRKMTIQARELGVDILAFPESLMTRFEADRNSFIAEAQDLDGTFPSQVDSIAREFGLWIVYTMNERNEMGKRPYNTAIITDSEGNKRGIYRKVHLFDSYSVTESERMVSGDCIFEPIESPFARLGLGICYDLRFPELARIQTLSGCQLLFFPAAWVDGPNKPMQWKALLRARAIEDEIFVAGICRADDGYVGESFVFAPDGTIIAQSRHGEEELVLAELDLHAIEDVRRKIPVLEHRRADIY